MTSDEMKGKVAVVTGGARGIGLAIVHRLLREGLSVVIADIDPEAGRAAMRESGGENRVTFFETDVSVEGAVRRMAAAAKELFGRIDFLINNAGIAGPHIGSLESVRLEDWNRMIAVNLTGAFLCVKHTVAELRGNRGAIVNISSTRAFVSEANTEAYSASKGGIVALTHALAITLGPEVRVNCISPGWIDTRGWKKGVNRDDVEPLAEQHHSQHPVGRVGKPEDIAAMAFRLLSPEQGFITGQNFVVDGGMTRKMIYK